MNDTITSFSSLNSEQSQRTEVIDDEMDYLSVESNVWLYPELKQKRETLFQKKHASRLNKSVMVTIDFAGRQAIQPADE
jgi:hypothetical protein